MENVNGKLRSAKTRSVENCVKFVLIIIKSLWARQQSLDLKGCLASDLRLAPMELKSRNLYVNI